jgi:hypothetical protein
MTVMSGRPSSPMRAALSVAAAAFTLVICDVLIRAGAFGTLARRVERALARESSRDSVAAVRHVKWAIDAAHRRLPWTVPCLATAIAANRLLAWRGIASELWLGVRTNETTRIDAHAWLLAEGKVVTGAAGKDAFRPLHALVTAPAPRR